MIKVKLTSIVNSVKLSDYVNLSRFKKVKQPSYNISDIYMAYLPEKEALKLISLPTYEDENLIYSFNRF